MQPNDDEVTRPHEGPDAPDPRTVGHEEFAGDPVPDGFGEEPKYRENAPDNQTPEVTEFGARAVESGDPEGEHRPNGDPRVIGQPAGGGDRDPAAPERPAGGGRG